MQNTERAGVALILLLMLALDNLDRYRIAPPWLAESIVAIVVLTMLLAAFTKTEFWHRAELVVIWSAVGLGLAYNTLNLGNVINRLVFHAVAASTLFFTAVATWINNVILFTLTYWLVDGGGPDAREHGANRPDFDFPSAHSREVALPWRAGLVDYLFVGFTTATAFSPTEAQPLTPRSKLLMIAQSVISLITVAVVAARAVNLIQ